MRVDQNRVYAIAMRVGIVYESRSEPMRLRVLPGVLRVLPDTQRVQRVVKK